MAVHRPYFGHLLFKVDEGREQGHNARPMKAFWPFVVVFGLPAVLVFLASLLVCGSLDVGKCWGPFDSPSYDERHDPG